MRATSAVVTVVASKVGCKHFVSAFVITRDTQWRVHVLHKHNTVPESFMH